MSRRELKAERKRREILRSAARAFKKKGYFATTMEDIASELLMTQGSLYYYFKSKEEILYACHECSMEHILGSLEWVSKAEAPAAAKIRTLVEEHVGVLVDDLQGSAMALEFTALSEPYLSRIVSMRDRYEAGLREIIRQGIEAGEFVPVNPRLSGFMLLGALNWISRWFDPQGALGPAALAQHFGDLFLRALGADPTGVRPLPRPAGAPEPCSE